MVEKKSSVKKTVTKEMLSKLILDAMKPNDDIAVRDLLESLEKTEPDLLKNEAEGFNKLCELWEAEIVDSDDKANICVQLAESSVLDTPACRAALHASIHKLLPPYLASGSVIKAIGAKDENVSVHDAAMRLRKLQHLRSTAIVYQQDTHQWGKIHGIDNVTGTIAIASLEGGSVSSVPIASAIFSLHFFNTTPEMMNLLYPGKHKCSPSSEYRRIFELTSLSEIHEQKIRDIVLRLMVPAIMSADGFESWWKAEECSAAEKQAGRPFWEARSVLELYTLLKPLADKGSVALSSEAAEILQKLFARLRKDMQPKDVAMLAECIACLADAAAPEVLAPMYQVLRGKAAFWPAVITQDMPLTALEEWGRLAVKPLAGFVKATNMLYTAAEMAQLGTCLPLKCIGVVFALVPEDVKKATVLAQKTLSCDMVLWIYKNKNTLPFEIVSKIDMARCIAALSIEGLPKEWGAAQRELRKDVFDKADFQKYIIDNAEGDIPSIINALQRYRKFQPGERQSIMVKLSRQSEDVQAYLESGAGSKLMGAGEKTTVEEPPITSIASQKRLADELQDLITRQIPANAAAVALARSYGDLRENAEYDAAKAERRRLHGRRSELERILGFLQPTDFKNIEVKDHAVIGSIVTLSDGAKDQEYYLLGAYDGDPDKHYVSYQAGIGKALIHKQVGESVDLPGSGKFTIKAVRPLPEDLRKELAQEA